MRKLGLLPSGFLAVSLVFASAGSTATLQAGPMVGYSSMREVAVWVQTDSPQRVQLRYRAKNSQDSFRHSAVVNTSADSAHTAHLIADQVEPGITYQYEILIGDSPVTVDYALEFQTQALWQWRGDPPDFSFVLGSCNYVGEARFDRPGKPYGSDHHIFRTIFEQQPDFMLWMGDNVYLREADWNSRSGIYRRYSHTRALPELQALLGSVHHYASWDDHDYGPNNSDRSFWNKSITLEAFKDFWANPNYGVGGGGVSGTFQWGDVQFFLLDDRWFRAPNDRTTGRRQIFGPRQEEWLIDSLQASQATFKFVATGGVFLYNGLDRESAAKVAPAERQRIIDTITREQIPGVVFLSGDVHHSRLVELPRENAYPLYEWTVSAFTAGATAPDNPERTNIVPDSIFSEHNFGAIRISGPRRNRLAKLRLIDHSGRQLWTREIRARDLCQPSECDFGH